MNIIKVFHYANDVCFFTEGVKILRYEVKYTIAKNQQKSLTKQKITRNSETY